MKNLVLTVNIPGKEANNMFGYSKDLYEASEHSIEAYAKRVNADFMILKDTSAFPDLHPAWQRMVMFNEVCKSFDKILYLDGDVVVRKAAPNIFDLMDTSDETVFTSQDIVQKKYGGPEGWPGFNIGVFACKREFHRGWNIRKEAAKWLGRKGDDQYCLNYMTATKAGSYFNLSRDWNNVGTEEGGKYFKHYAGRSKHEYHPSILED